MELAVVENLRVCACLRFQVVKEAEACCIDQLQADFVPSDFPRQRFCQCQRFFRRVYV